MHSVLSATGHKSVWNGSALSARKCTPQLAHRPAVRGRKPEEGTDALLDVVKLEEAKYASLCVAVINDRSPWMVDDIFDQSMFWAQQKNTLPVHYALWVAEVGCCKVASANVETVFSGAGKISNKSRTLDPQLLSDYALLPSCTTTTSITGCVPRWRRSSRPTKSCTARRRATPTTSRTAPPLVERTRRRRRRRKQRGAGRTRLKAPE